jgi:hypothetical protein
MDLVNHPPHYLRKEGGPECIDAIEAALSEEEYKGYIKGNVIKYLWREMYKGREEDLNKAHWYLERHRKYLETRKKYPA